MRSRPADHAIFSGFKHGQQQRIAQILPNLPLAC